MGLVFSPCELARYHIRTDGRTSFESLHGYKYSGMAVEFAECVLYREPMAWHRKLSGGRRQHKGDPQLHRGVWVGKREAGDLHIVLTQRVRFPDGKNLYILGNDFVCIAKHRSFFFLSDVFRIVCYRFWSALGPSQTSKNKQRHGSVARKQGSAKVEKGSPGKHFGLILDTCLDQFG